MESSNWWEDSEISNLSDIATVDIAATAFNAADPGSPCDTVTYSPTVGEIQAIVGPEEIDDRPGREGDDHDVRIRRVMFQTADVSPPPAVAGVTIVFGGVTYGLTRIDWSDATAWQGVFAQHRRGRREAGRATMEEVT